MINIHKESPSRLTNQKLLIYETVKKSAAHLSANEIYRHTKKHIPRLSLATVYRNLEQLSAAGLLAKTQLGEVVRYEKNTLPHYHVTCLSCGRLDDIDSIPATDIEDHFRQATPYHLTSHQLILYGLCPACQKKR